MSNPEKKEKAKTPKEEKFVTKETFESAIGAILSAVEQLKEKTPVLPETEEEKKVTAAGPNKVSTNDEWDATAREILGEYVDHTEVAHERSGGVKFTVVIKEEKSNAPKDYLERVRSDRRTREVGASGMDGVIEWCKQIRQNLKRTEQIGK